MGAGDRGENFVVREKRGYVAFGAAKVGANGKHAVQLMQRTGSVAASPSEITTPIIQKIDNDDEQRETPAGAVRMGPGKFALTYLGGYPKDEHFSCGGAANKPNAAPLKGTRRVTP
jgi:hypothetical protein